MLLPSIPFSGGADFLTRSLGEVHSLFVRLLHGAATAAAVAMRFLINTSRLFLKGARVGKTAGHSNVVTVF